MKTADKITIPQIKKMLEIANDVIPLLTQFERIQLGLFFREVVKREISDNEEVE